MKNPYGRLGSGLVLVAAFFIPLAYFILDSVPFAAIGMSALIIGFTCLALAKSRPYVSPETSELFLKTGMENISALLEELGLRNKAVYLPSKMREGRPQAIIPIQGEIDPGLLKSKISGRMIVRFGNNPEDMAIAVTTPGGVNFSQLETKPGPLPADIETAITYLLIGLLDLATSVNVMTTGNTVVVEVSGSDPGYANDWYQQCLGSPIASIAATVTCEALSKPIRISDEHRHKKKVSITLEVLG